MRAGIVALTAMMVWCVAGAMREPHVTVVGDTAPDFAVTTESGRRLAARDLRGRVVVLNFWASWCEPCIAETPSLNAFADAFRASGVVVLGISINRNEQAYRAFLKRFRIGFETARDAEARISSAYGTFQIPETYIIGKDGVVAAKFISNQDWMRPEVMALVRSIL